jgi:capsule polysaccharide export protein KpsE/RkpR
VEKEVEASRERLIKEKNRGASDVEIEVARERLASSLRTLVKVEEDAARGIRRLEVISGPTLSTEHSRPRRLWGIATVLLVALSLGLVVLLVGDFIREHARF